MTTWLIPRADLTSEQSRAVELPITGHRLIVGPAGSGKTQVLMHRAAFLREHHGISDDRYRIFIFTNVLKQYVRSSLSMLNLPETIVSTFDAWCVEYYESNISQGLPMNPAAKAVDFDEVRRATRVHLETKRRAPYFDFVLVDEGQDLTSESYQILSLVARHVTVFADPLQRLYEDGADLAAMAAALGIARPSVSFLGAYRNNPEVARLAACFIADETRRREYLAQAKGIRRGARERPLLFVADSFDQEMDRLAEVVRARQLRNERVGIVVPQRRQVYGFAAGLRERGTLVEKAVPPPLRERATGAGEISFDEPTPKITSYHGAKGLTFDVVLLPRLTQESFRVFSRNVRLSMLFVGIARATDWAYLSTVQGKELHELASMRNAAVDDALTIQEAHEYRSASSAHKSQTRLEDDDLTL